MNQRFLSLPQEKQDRILNAAMKVFADSSFRQASTIEIARDAGISKALLFHYFTNKMDLYFHLFAYCTDHIVKELADRRLDGERDFFRLLLHNQQCKTDIMVRHPQLFEFLIRAYCEEDAEIRSGCLSIQEKAAPDNLGRFLEYVDKSRFRDGVDPSRLLQMLIWCGDGFMREKFRQPVVVPEEINREFAAILLMLQDLLYKEETP